MADVRAMLQGARTIVVGGATASGKSALALALAQQVSGEIVCADSRQVYAGIRIASAGPTDDDTRRVPHHLFGQFDPTTTTMSAGLFVHEADAAIAAVHARDRIAIVVGGTGLYLRALRVGIDDETPGDPAVRAQLHGRLTNEGLEALVRDLQTRAPDVAAAIDVRNPMRVLRALERVLGGHLDAPDMARVLARPARASMRDAVWWRVDISPEALGARIEHRTRMMFHDGIEQEAAALRARVGASHPLCATIGVAEALLRHDGALSLDAAHEATAVRTRQYARRQRTWFRKEPWWCEVPAEMRALADDR